MRAQRLFANHRDPLPEPVKCHRKTAAMYMAIASNDALSNVTSMLHLPSDFTILYDLSRIDEPGLKVAFKEGWITLHYANAMRLQCKCNANASSNALALLQHC